MNVYLAGPMSGYENYNYPAFDAAATRLRELGLTVESPHEIDSKYPGRAVYNDPQQEWRFYMSKCIPMVFQADAIVMLPGWSTSNGACIEHQIAEERGIHIYMYDSPEFERTLSLLAAVG